LRRSIFSTVPSNVVTFGWSRSTQRIGAVMSLGANEVVATW
jgi:hypothetical protein